MKIKRDKLDLLAQRGKTALVSKPEPKVAAPPPVIETAPNPPAKKKWRFDVERNWDGYITNVIATEL